MIVVRILIFFLTAITFNSLLYAYETDPYQIEFLQQLYDATDGPNWDWRNSGTEWSFSASSATNPCLYNWQGITCDICEVDYEVGYCITELQLPNYNLVGNIESLTYFEYMTTLTVLDLSENYITGYVNEYIYLASALANVSLQYNELTGALTSYSASFPDLVYLRIDHNKLRGEVPVFIKSSPLLEHLDMSSNLLTGNLEGALGTLQYLTFLSTSNNLLSGNKQVSFS